MTAPVELPPIDRAAVTPTVADVAILLRTRTVGYAPAAGGLGGDSGPADVSVFDDTTRPTATEVEQVIEIAADEVLAQMPAHADWPQQAAITRAIAVRAAAIIEQSFFRETATDLSGAYGTSMSALTAAVGSGDVAIASGLSLREQEVQAALEGIPLLPVV